MAEYASLIRLRATGWKEMVMCETTVMGERAVLALVRTEYETKYECEEWGPWTKWGPWGEWVPCTLGTTARARVRSHVKECTPHKWEICHYAATYLGPGEDDWTLESAVLENDLGASGPARQEVQDEYEYGFCFFSTLLANVINQPTGEYVVGLPMDHMAEVVAGYSIAAVIPSELASHIREQSYTLDGSPLDIPVTLSNLSPGPHVFAGNIINASGARFSIIYPFHVVPALAATISSSPAENTSSVHVSNTVIIHNRQLDDLSIQAVITGPPTLRAAVFPANITIPSRSSATVRIDVGPGLGPHKISDICSAPLQLNLIGSKQLVSIDVPNAAKTLALQLPRRPGAEISSVKAETLIQPRLQ